MQAALVGSALGGLLLCFVAYGWAGMQHGQNKGFLNWIASQAVDTVKGGLWLTEQIVPLTSFLAHELGHAFNVTYAAAARWIGGVENYIQMKGAAYANFAVAVDAWMIWALNHKIPSLIKALPNSVTHLVHTVTTRVVHVEKTIVKLPGLTKAQVRAAVAVAIPGIIANDLPYFQWLKDHLKALERVLSGAAGAVIGSSIPSVRDLIGIRKRIGKLERALTHRAAAGLVAVAIATLGVSWIRCTNWKRLGRGFCHLPSSAITNLLGLITDIFVLADVCRVVELLEEALKTIEPELAAFIGEVGGALCHGDFEAPPVLTVPAVYVWDASQIAA